MAHGKSVRDEKRDTEMTSEELARKEMGDGNVARDKITQEVVVNNKVKITRWLFHAQNRGARSNVAHNQCQKALREAGRRDVVQGETAGWRMVHNHQHVDGPGERTHNKLLYHEVDGHLNST